MDDSKLLQEVDWITVRIANELLAHFGSGRNVAQSACRYWGELMEVDGVSEDRARSLFHDMRDAGVFHDLRGY